MDFSRDFLSSGQNILVEHYEDDFEPTEEEVLEYCNMLGLDADTEPDLLYIAREGIRAPLPVTWKPVEDPSGNIYYFNFETGQSIWEHPCDEFYKNLLKQERQKKAAATNKPNNKKRPNAAKKPQSKKTAGGKKGLMNGDGSTSMGKRGIGGDLSGKPALGSLAPLSSLGGHGSLSGMGNLPKLRKVPPSLAPLQISGKSASSGTDDPFKKPLGQGGFKPGPGLAPLSSSKGTLGSLGHVDLGTVNISNQYEEEEESDSEEKSDENFDGRLQSKFGVNFLDAKDLSLKESDGEDVSKELRKLMNDSGTSNTSEEIETFHKPSGSLFGANSSTAQNGVHGSGSDLSKNTGKLRPVVRGQKLGVLDNTSATRKGPLEVSQQSRLPVPNKTLPLGNASKESSLQQRGETSSMEASKDLSPLEAKHQATLAEMESSHKKRLEKLRQEMKEEVQALENTLMQEKEAKVTGFRKRIASEQVTEEKELKAKKESHLCRLQAKLEEEQEDEEAKLMDEKQDNLRKLRNKISADLEKEKRDIENSSQEIHKKRLEQKMKEEEDKLQSSVQEELEQQKKRLSQETEKERKALESAHKDELELLKKKLDADHIRLKEELQARHQEEADSLKAQAEAEHEKRLEEVQAELKRRLDIEETKARLLQSFKDEEAEIMEQFEMKLESEKSELSVQHAAEMETLKLDLRHKLDSINEEAELEMKANREKLEKELNNTRKALEQEHESKLVDLRDAHRLAEAQLEQEKLDQVKALEAMQSEYEVKKAGAVRKLAELAQQAEGIEEKKRRVQAKEKEVGLEENRLVQLRSANALETEELLKKQDSELKVFIKNEEAHLEKLKKARSVLESEILELNDQKSAAESKVKQLKQEELDHNVCLEKLQEENHPREFKLPTPLVPGSSDTESHQPVYSQAHAGPKKSFREEPKAGKEPAAALQESWMVTDEDEDVDDHSVSMSLQDLELTGGAPNKTTNLEELERMKLRMSQWHKGIHKALEEERMSLNKRRSYFQKKESTLKKRQVDYQLANMAQKSHKRRQKQLCNDDNVALMAEIQSKLDQEAAALTELEKKVKASNRLLDRKEEGVNQFQAFTRRQQTDTPPLPVQALSTFDEKLSRLNSALSSIKNKRRGYGESQGAQLYRSTRDELEPSSSNSSSDESDVVKELRRRHYHNSVSPAPSSPPSHHSQPFVSPLPPHLSSSHAGLPATTEPSWNVQHHSMQRSESGMPQLGRTTSSNSVMGTLMSINAQVAELMSRVGSSTDTNASYVGTSSGQYPRTLPQNHSVRNYPTPPPLNRRAEAHVESTTTDRWAELVATPRIRTPAKEEERNLSSKDHQSALGTPSIFPPSTNNRCSTEAQLKKQTDWLKEFTQHTSQLRSRRPTGVRPSTPLLTTTPTGMGSQTTGSATLDHLKFAGRPKLILDSRDKIQLIHV